MKPQETVTNVTYQNGKRVSTVTRTETRSDDAEMLGNYYYRLADIYRRLDIETDETALTALNADKNTILGQIEIYKTYLAGYDTENTED